MASQATQRSARALRPGWWLRGWLVGASIFLISGICRLKDWLYRSEQWSLTEWQLVGEPPQTQRQAIQQVLENLQPFGSFMAQDLHVIRQQLELLPWIAEVRVRKQWPNRLLLYCEEHQAVARWQQQLLNQRGERFSAPLSPGLDKQLPQLAGPEGSERQVLATWRQLAAQLAPYGLSVTAIKRNRCQAWQLTIDHSVHCLIGKQNPHRAMQRLLILYPLLMQHRPVKTEAEELEPVVDLRYQHGAAVRWEPKQRKHRDRI